MQGLLQTVRFRTTKYPHRLNGARPETGLRNTTVAEVLSTKGQDKAGSWLWCRTDDTAYDAVKQVSEFPLSFIKYHM